MHTTTVVIFSHTGAHNRTYCPHFTYPYNTTQHTLLKLDEDLLRMPKIPKSCIISWEERIQWSVPTPTLSIFVSLIAYNFGFLHKLKAHLVDCLVLKCVDVYLWLSLKIMRGMYFFLLKHVFCGL